MASLTVPDRLPPAIESAWREAQSALIDCEASLAKLAMEISTYADCPMCADQAIQAMAIIQQFRSQYTETLAEQLQERICAVEMFREAFG
jgi:hypothetical protein